MTKKTVVQNSLISGILLALSVGFFMLVFDEPMRVIEAPAPSLISRGSWDESLTPLDPEQEEAILPQKTREPAATETPTAAATPPSPSEIKLRVLRWDRVPGATSYHVKAWIVTPSGSKAVFLDQKIKTTEITLGAEAPRDKIYWQVAGLDTNGEEGDAAGPIVLEP
jgi:hypothetical protein